jgi:hypothetical protein
MTARKKQTAPTRKKKVAKGKGASRPTKKAPELPAAIPLPTSTTDPGYQAWLESVESFGGVSPEEVVKERKGGPVMDMTRSPNPPRVIPRVPFETENGVTEYWLENVDGEGIAATTREGLEDRRGGLLQGIAHERERLQPTVTHLQELLDPGHTKRIAPQVTPLPQPDSLQAISNENQGRGGSGEDGEESTIPTERRTRPLGVAEAAKLMGYLGSPKQVTKALRSAMTAGAIKFIMLTRKSYIFDRFDFVSESQKHLGPVRPV